MNTKEVFVGSERQQLIVQNKTSHLARRTMQILKLFQTVSFAQRVERALK